jgi:hypothetical protein
MALKKSKSSKCWVCLQDFLKKNRAESYFLEVVDERVQLLAVRCRAAAVPPAVRTGSSNMSGGRASFITSLLERLQLLDIRAN